MIKITDPSTGKPVYVARRSVVSIFPPSLHYVGAEVAGCFVEWENAGDARAMNAMETAEEVADMVMGAPLVEHKKQIVIRWSCGVVPGHEHVTQEEAMMCIARHGG